MSWQPWETENRCTAVLSSSLAVPVSVLHCGSVQMSWKIKFVHLEFYLQKWIASRCGLLKLALDKLWYWRWYIKLPKLYIVIINIIMLLMQGIKISLKFWSRSRTKTITSTEQIQNTKSSKSKCSSTVDKNRTAWKRGANMPTIIHICRHYTPAHPARGVIRHHI